MSSYIPDQQIDTGSFVPSTNVWDVSDIYEVDVTSDDFKELLVRLYQNLNLMSLVLNSKDSAFYLNEEFVTSQLFFNTTNDPLSLRPTFRKVFNIGTLGAGVTTTAHNLSIGSTWKFTRIYGTASKTTVTASYYPIPYAGAAGAYIAINLTSTNIVIDNNSGVSFTDCYVVVEYVKF